MKDWLHKKMSNNNIGNLSVQYPRIVIIKNQEILIEGCKKVLIYEENLVQIKTVKMDIVIYGQKLNLRTINPENIIITGVIQKLEYLND